MSGHVLPFWQLATIPTAMAFADNSRFAVVVVMMAFFQTALA
jgi:hypothetical protein